MIRFTQAVFWPITIILIGTSISIFLFMNRLITQFDPNYNIDETRLLIEKILQNKLDLEEDINDLIKQHETLSELVISPSDRNELENLKQKLNLTELRGEGIKIDISLDSKQLGYSTMCIAPHLRDLRNIINLEELEVKGVSINEYRLGYNSVINCMGNGLIIDYTRIIPSLEIKIIGNPERLYNILSTKKHLPLLWNDVENGIINFHIQKENSILLQPFSGNARTDYINTKK